MTGPSTQPAPQDVLVVMAHPAAASLTRDIAAAIMDAVRARGHRIEMADLVAEGFDPVFGPADHAAFTGTGEAPDDVRAEQRRIDQADHLILVYPVYWWGMPAVLKGWIDRVFVAGWAFDEDAGGGIAKRLGRLKISLLAIGGASAATYAKRGYRHAMQVQVEAGICDFCGAPLAASTLVTPEQLAAPHAPQQIADALVNRAMAT